MVDVRYGKEEEEKTYAIKKSGRYVGKQNRY